MSAPLKYILHSPISDKGRLEVFVEKCFEERGSLIAVLGAGSAELENWLDEIIVGDGSDESRFISTTTHPDEDFEQVLSFVNSWEIDKGGAVVEARF